jgi:D-xylose transport system substrate-binding protein
LTEAKTDLTQGDCILIVAAVDSTAAAAIVTAAEAQQVPVIAYDRFINSDDLNAYVSYDNTQTGDLQGQYIVAHYQDAQYHYDASYRRNNIAFINGSPTDGDAKIAADGAHQVLDSLITAGTFNNVYEQYTPNGDPTIGEQEMATALSAQTNNIQVVVAGNDDLADGAIQALVAAQQGGQVLVTGAGATVPGLQHILEGLQAMTVYQSIPKEAQAVALIAEDLYTKRALSTNTTFRNPQGSASIPSLLVPPIAVDKSNMASTVIADGAVTTSDLCTGLPAGTDTGGICP